LKKTSASNPSRIVTGSLFIVYGRIILRRLEDIFMPIDQVVGINTLPNLFGSYFRKWWQYVNCVARNRGRRKRSGRAWQKTGRFDTGVDG
jgi:hypothetical protein